MSHSRHIIRVYRGVRGWKYAVMYGAYVMASGDGVTWKDARKQAVEAKRKSEAGAAKKVSWNDDRSSE